MKICTIYVVPFHAGLFYSAALSLQKTIGHWRQTKFKPLSDTQLGPAQTDRQLTATQRWRICLMQTGRCESVCKTSMLLKRTFGHHRE